MPLPPTGLVGSRPLRTTRLSPPPTVLTGKREAGSPQCRPFSQEVEATLCDHQCSEILHLSVRPRPGPAAEDSHGSGTPANLQAHPPPTHMGSAQPSPHPSQAPSANIARTHPGDHTAIEAGQPGVIVGDLLLHHPVGRQCHETTRMRAGSHQWALEGTPPHILVQGACQPRVSRHMPRCRQSVWMPLPGAIPSGGPLSSSCRPSQGPGQMEVQTPGSRAAEGHLL